MDTLWAVGLIDEIVERRIADAQRNGDLDRLEGHGKPIADLDRPRRAGWWARRLVKDELADLAHTPEMMAVRRGR